MVCCLLCFSAFSELGPVDLVPLGSNQSAIPSVSPLLQAANVVLHLSRDSVCVYDDAGSPSRTRTRTSRLNERNFQDWVSKKHSFRLSFGYHMLTTVTSLPPGTHKVEIMCKCLSHGFEPKRAMLIYRGWKSYACEEPNNNGLASGLASLRKLKLLPCVCPSWY